MMTEESNDDTNGESTFEFVGAPVPPSGSGSGGVTEPQTPSTQMAAAPDFQTVPPPPPLFSQASLPPGPQLMPPTYYSPLPAEPATSPPAAPSQPPPPPVYQAHYTIPSPTSPPPSTAAAPHTSQPCCSSTTASLEMPLSTEPCQPSSNRGVWGWIKSNEFLHRVAEKAKNSVDTMITTLDPGMKELLHSGGDISLLVVSEDEEVEVSAVREAFQQVFGLATVEGYPLPPVTGAPAQSVGFSVCIKTAAERLAALRHMVGEDCSTLLTMESLLVETTPDKWFEMTCLLLEDSARAISLHTYTQPIPIDGEFVARAREQTPSDYPLAWLGLAVPIGAVIGHALGVHQREWHHALGGVPRRQMLHSAAQTLATLYKSQLHR